MTLVLRDYQVAGVQEARRRIGRGVKRLLLVMSTGGGKTALAAHIALGAIAKGKSVLFLAHRREIVAQSYWKIVEAGVPEENVGVIMADGIIPHYETRAPYIARRPNASVQVASVQTLVRRALPPADVVFIDEAHHAPAGTWKKLSNHYQQTGAVFVGLTATPCRLDGKGLDDTFEDIHVIASFKLLAEQGFLVAPRIFTKPAPDLRGVKVTAGDYNAGQLESAVNKRELIGNIVSHWQERAEGRSTVVFAAGVAHSKAITELFKAAGVKAEHLDGETPTTERDAILRRLHEGTTQVVSNCSVLTEGFDEPRVKCVVLAKPTKSLGLHLQTCGRGLRPWNGQSALLLDHAGCCLAHGRPQDDREWTLEGTKKDDDKAPSEHGRICPHCEAFLDKGSDTCNECGYVFPPRKLTPDHVDGKLVELSPEEAEARANEKLSETLKKKINGAVWRHARATAAACGGLEEDHAIALNRTLVKRFGRRAKLAVEALRAELAYLDALPLDSALAPTPEQTAEKVARDSGECMDCHKPSRTLRCARCAVIHKSKMDNPDEVVPFA